MAETQIIRVAPLEWALAMHESLGVAAPVGAKRKAWRFEPGFLASYVDPSLPEEERNFRATSFGCWQIMGQVLRELGHNEPIDRFASSAAMQLVFHRAEWKRKLKDLRRRLHREPEVWRQVEAWNKGAAGAARLKDPTSYHALVMAQLRRAPLPGPDGLVDLVTVEQAARR